jgi:serine/threonine protein phosphatase PrpC
VWRHIAESTRGETHLADNSPCQDSSRVIVLGSDADETLVACVADGAGSAKHSAIGSKTAAASIVESATAYFERNSSFAGLVLDDVVQWCDDARARITEDAAARGADLRAMATTLCAAIVSPTCSFFFQIGDGAIILVKNNVSGVVFWPQSGEYANTTNFLTSNEYRNHLQFSSTSIRTPHRPFFEPLFQALRTNDDSKGLAHDLRKFLQSESVRSRSDDDRTLILASHIGLQNDHAD